MWKVTKNNYGNKIATIDKNFFHFSVEVANDGSGLIFTNESNRLQTSVKKKELESTLGKIKKVSLDTFIDYAKNKESWSVLREIELTSTEAGIEQFMELLPKSFR